jgi:hypothetical protein
MPGKSKGTSIDKGELAKISPPKLRRIWNQVSMQDWMHVLRVVHASNKWSLTGRRIMGLCPFHQDKKPSFTIDFDRQHAKCFSPDCGKYFWDPIRFYKEIQATPMTYPEALAEMKDRFNIQLALKTIKQMGKLHAHRQMKRILYTVLNGELTDVAHVKPHNDILYGQNTVRYLKHRQIPDVYHCLPIGILPPKNRLQKLIDDYAARENIDSPWEQVEAYFGKFLDDTLWLGALLFFTGDSPSEIGRIKIYGVPQFKNGIYMEDEKARAFIPDEYELHNGIFGLFGAGPYQPMFASKTIKSFVLVEGEFDALSIMSRQFDSGDINFMVFSGGGGAVGSLDLMRAFGFQVGYVVPDRDKPGDNYARAILQDTLKLSVRVFQWPLTLDIPAKAPEDKIDPDDAVKFHGFEKVDREFRKNENYKLPYRWALERAERAMADIPEDDIRYLTNVAAKWGRFVRDNSEQQAYLQEISKTYNVNAGLILNEMIAGDDNEEAFIERLRLVLSGRLHVLHSIRTGNSDVLRVFDRITNEIYDLFLNEPKKIVATVELMMRKDLYKFIREDVGEPGFLLTYEEAVQDKQLVYMKYSNALAGYLAKAVARLASALPAQSDVRPMAAGLHCVVEGDGQHDEEVTLYLVNGMAMYKGLFDKAGQLLWKKLLGPADGNYVVFADRDNRPQTIYPLIKNADDLNRDPGATIHDLFEELRDVIRVGWDFKHHHVTCDLLTAIVMQQFIANCLPRQPVLMFTSEQSGGKSSFIGGLLGGITNPNLKVVPAIFMDNYTAAGVRQSMNYSTVPICLDEFEDKGGNDRKSQAVRACLLVFRGLANAEGNTILGTASGRHQEFKIHAPVNVAGIRVLHDPADISRFIIVEMDRKLKRPSPEDSIIQTFGLQKIRRLRDLLPRVMFRHAREVRQALYDIADEYRDGKGLLYGRITRSREHYYGALAIMKVAGIDYDRFIKEYFKANKSNLERIATTSLSNDIFTEVLNNPEVRIPDIEDTRPRTINAVLSSDSPEVLNHSNSGCYYDKPTKWLIVDWATAKYVVLKNTPHASKPLNVIKREAERCEYHVPDSQVLRTGVFERLKGFLGRLASHRNISVYRVNALVEDTEQVNRRVVRGIEDIDYSSEYADQLANISFPTPPGVDITDAKKTSKAGTSKKDSSGSKTDEGGEEKLDPDVDDHFSY